MKPFIFAFFLGSSLLPAQEKAAPEFSDRLSEIAAHLGQGGVHYSITDHTGDLTDLATVLDEIFASFPESPLPPSLKFADLVTKLGLDQIGGTGRSSARMGEYWHNRSFIFTGPQRKGVLSLVGQNASPWRVPTFAPAGTDLALELELDLRKVEKIIRTVSTAAASDPREILEERISAAGMTLAAFLTDFKVRASVALWMSETKTFEVGPEMSYPVPHLAIRIENAALLWKAFTQEIRESGEVIEKDGEITVISPKTEAPFGPTQAQLTFVEKTGELWIALRPEDLAAARGNDLKLAASPNFQATLKNLPKAGNGLAYISPAFVKMMQKISTDFGKQQEEVAQFGGRSDPSMAIVLKMIHGFLEDMDSPNGYATTLAVLENGWLTASNSPIPDKGSQFTSMTSVGTIAALAGLSAPVVLSARKAANLTQHIGNLRQLGHFLYLYDSDHGSFPDDLSKLVAENYLDGENFDSLSPDSYELIQGLSSTSPLGSIVLYLKQPIDGKVAFLRDDLSVQQMPVEEFQELLQKQLNPE